MRHTTATATHSGDPAPASNATFQAAWNGAVLATSARTIIVEGNHYFPPEDVEFTRLERSDTATVCPWKGVAAYYDIVIDGERNHDAAWYYPAPRPAAGAIKDHVAFSSGVTVTAIGTTYADAEEIAR